MMAKLRAEVSFANPFLHKNVSVFALHFKRILEALLIDNYFFTKVFYSGLNKEVKTV